VSLQGESPRSNSSFGNGSFDNANHSSNGHAIDQPFRGLGAYEEARTAWARSHHTSAGTNTHQYMIMYVCIHSMRLRHTQM
jgi:hypothetical protein